MCRRRRNRCSSNFFNLSWDFINTYSFRDWQNKQEFMNFTVFNSFKKGKFRISFFYVILKIAVRIANWFCQFRSNIRKIVIKTFSYFFRWGEVRLTSFNFSSFTTVLFGVWPSKLLIVFQAPLGSFFWTRFSLTHWHLLCFLPICTFACQRLF